MAPSPASNAPSGPARSRRVMVHVPEGEVLVGRPDQVAIEEPLEIRLEAPGQPDASVLTVTMRTPGNDVELVAGWLLAEGVIDTADDVARISYCVDAAIGGDQRFNVVTARLRRPAKVSGREPMTATSSACGVCGTASIEALRSVGLPPTPEGPRYSLSVLANLTELLCADQPAFEPPSVHGVALVDGRGQPLAIREDVGRHNAVDKAIGWALLNRRLPMPDAALVVSGRVSFEIVKKAARAGVGLIAAFSGASSLAVTLAEEAGITLVGFVRGARCVVYSGSARIIANQVGSQTH